MKLVQMKFDFSLLNDEIISIHKEINDRESSDEHRDEIRGIRRRKTRIIGNEYEINSSNEDIAEDTENVMDNMYRIGKYTVKNTICIQRKICKTAISSNINKPLDFFKTIFYEMNEIKQTDVIII